MPRVKHVKARKDYPNQGIVKGEMYYYTKMKTGPRSSKVMRSKTPFTQSQLTSSPFKQAWYGMQEEWERGDKDAEAITAAAEAIREIGEEAQNNFDNMPEGLQQGDTGQMIENRANEAERIADELDTLAQELTDLEEPDEMEEPEGDDESNPDGWAAFEQWQEEHDHYQSELARIPEEAGDLIGDMPE